MLGRQPALELLEVIGSESHGDSVAGDRLDQTGRDGGVVVEQQTLANEHPRDPSRRRVDLDRLDVADAVAGSSWLSVSRTKAGVPDTVGEVRTNGSTAFVQPLPATRKKLRRSKPIGIGQ